MVVLALTNKQKSNYGGNKPLRELKGKGEQHTNKRATAVTTKFGHHNHHTRILEIAEITIQTATIPEKPAQQP